MIKPSDYYSYAGTSQSAWNDIIGQQVTHRSHGRGTIVRVQFRADDLPLIYISFNPQAGAKEEHSYLTGAFRRKTWSDLTLPPALMEKLQLHGHVEADWNEEARRPRKGERQALGPEVVAPKLAATQRVRGTGTPPGSSPEVESICRQYGIKWLYHITNVANLHGILAEGLLCRNKVKDYTDISDLGIQRRRSYKTLSQNRRIALHDCVPLFLAAMTPMLSALRDQQAQIIYLHIDPKVLDLPGAEFTDGNASNCDTLFFHRLEDFSRLDWEILRARYWNSPDLGDPAENRRRRAAEVLVPDRVPTTYIGRITAMTHDAYSQAMRIVQEARKSILVKIDRSMYFAQDSYASPNETRHDGIPTPEPPFFEEEIPF